MAFPNFLLPKGLGFLGWVALAPLFAVVPEFRLRSGMAAGAAYGALLYALSDYWLWTYHPAALAVACLHAAAFLAVLFPILGLVSRSFPKRGLLAFPFLWLSYEFLRSRGFLGYPYGVLGYSFWRDPNLLGLASAGGVWLVSLAACSVNASLGKALRSVLEGRRRASVVAAALALGIAAASTILGGLSGTDWAPRSRLRAALVQPGYRERQRSLRDYRAVADRLLRLTEEARREKPDLIVWHETAVVPPLEWHLRFRPNRETLELALRLDGYIRSLDVPLLFGNGRAESASSGGGGRKNWNSAFLFEGGREAARYDKIRLVPFSESFPAADRLPRIAAAIEAEVGYFWEKGRDLTVFRLRDASFSTPICFEDSFGDHARSFADAGADFLVVLTDDSWGKALSCQYQHLGQSVLRAAELGIPVARAANTGSTALIGPDGGILAELPPFSEGVLFADIPLPPEGRMKTLYHRFGDFIGWAALGVSAAWTAAALVLRLRVNRKERAGENPNHSIDNSPRL